MGRLSWIVWVSGLRVLSEGKPEGQSRRRRHDNEAEVGGLGLEVRTGPQTNENELTSEPWTRQGH